MGCDQEDSYAMLRCLRRGEEVTWEMIVEAQHRVEPNVREGVGGCVIGDV